MTSTGISRAGAAGAAAGATAASKVAIGDLIAQERVIIDLKASSKTHVLQELSRRAAVILNLDPMPLFEALLSREKLGSTGLGDGTAIPHARLPEISSPFGLFARLASPIDFEAIDGEPVDLVFLLLLPGPAEGGQLSALACVARRLASLELRAALRKAEDAGALYRELTAPLA